MKYVSSPLGPLLVGAVLLVVVVIFSTWISDPGAADGKARFFPLLLVALPAIPIIFGLLRIGPRRRYVAATTPEQRREHKAAARHSSRLPAAGEPLDYGERLDTNDADTNGADTNDADTNGADPGGTDPSGTGSSNAGSSGADPGDAGR